MISSKITKRWLRNSFAVIVGILLVIEVVAAIGIQRSYYGQVERILENRVEVVANTLEQYAKEGETDFLLQVEKEVVAFPYKEEMELMVVDANGETRFTSSGFHPSSKAMPDYLNAIENNQRIGKAIGTLGTKQKVMIVAVPYVTDDLNVSTLRLATDLTQVDYQIAGIIIIMIFLGFIVLGLVLFSSSYFINSIVIPIGLVGDTAKRIATGDFNTRLTVKNNDEIGELAGVINFMAGELGTAEQLKNDFISSVSHELRTPLTAIQGWGETLLYNAGEDKELTQKGMQVIINETQRLSGMVEELLDFSRMQSGRLKLVKTKMDIITELSEAVLMYTQKAQREKIALLYEEPEEFAFIYGDKNRLRQVFINIIDNAIKYSDPGDTVTVMVTLYPEDIKIEVQDTGIGISQKDLPQITTKFYKADSTRRGSGIGLAVAEEIIRRHEGLLTVDSVQGKGTLITILLPRFHGKEPHVTVENHAE